jgi:hypothetical protein
MLVPVAARFTSQTESFSGVPIHNHVGQTIDENLL